MTEINQKTRFRIEGMDCAGCATKVDKVVRRAPGVHDVNVSVTAGTMVVDHDDQTDLDGLGKKVKSLGYGISRQDEPAASAPVTAGLHGHEHGAEEGSFWGSAKARLTIACGLALGLAFVIARFYPDAATWIFLAAMAVGLIPIARRAVMAAINGMPFTIETLMSVAAIGAVLIGASEEAAVVVFLFLVGELLENIASGRARASIKALASLVPKTALLEQNGKTVEVAAASLGVDAIILVRPGDRIPADGTILTGETAIDESPMTGESVPKLKQQGDNVFAGTINQNAAIRVQVSALAKDNTIARIIRLVEEAQETKAPTERFIDRFSKYYTPGVMVVAALVALVPPLMMGGVWDEWIYKGLAVLLIGCPCALVISTPAAIAASLSAGARRGMLMKGGAVLETLGKVTRAAFDKTGTLTEGKPKVTDITGIGQSAAAVLQWAADLEAESSHPLAKAILAEAEREGITPASVENGRAIGGAGVTGRSGDTELFLGAPQAAAKQVALPDAVMAEIEALNASGKTVSVLIANGQLAGMIAMRDEPRDDAIAGIKALSDLGISSVMLTGDNQRTADAIAASLGMEARAELLPEDKQRIVSELRQSGAIVAKIGDGINDAPALATADVGIAMGGGTDVALETADAAVLHGRVMDVAGMVSLSRATMTNIWQNITIALGLKGVFLVTTILGITGLWPAILADTGATVLVTANAMRLLAWRGLPQTGVQR